MDVIYVYDDVNRLVSELAEDIVTASKNAIQARGQFNLVLSGGNSPKYLYELLASEKFAGKIDWEKIFFFFGDERFVPEDDERKNYNMVDRALFKPLGIKKSNIFKIDTSESAEIAARKYNTAIQHHFKEMPIAFDYILLGLGDNAHTASLFPHTAVLNESKAEVCAVFVEEAGMYRITMTAPLINRSKNISFLVFGKEKASAIYHVLEDNTGSSNEYPARLIQSDFADVKWFIDTMAAAQLSREG